MNNLNNIEEVANYIVSDGKGILAADESNPTCGKRFDSIGVESNEENSRDYRERLFRSAGMKGNIGGVILFDETIRQKAEDGTPLVNIILDQGALPGIKVDQGLQPIGESEESLTQGLEGLDERLKEYYSLGAKFTADSAINNVVSWKRESFGKTLLNSASAIAASSNFFCAKYTLPNQY